MQVSSPVSLGSSCVARVPVGSDIRLEQVSGYNGDLVRAACSPLILQVSHGVVSA